MGTERKRKSSVASKIYHVPTFRDAVIAAKRYANFAILIRNVYENLIGDTGRLAGCSHQLG